MEETTPPSLLKRPQRIWVHTIIYALLTSTLIVGCFLTLRNYVKYQPIILETTVPLTTEELTQTIPVQVSKTSVKQYVTEDELSRLFFTKLKDYNPPIGKDLNLKAYYYDVRDQISYFNFTGEDDKLYSFTAKTKLEAEDDQIVLSLSDFKLGKYKIALLGKYYSKKLDITDSIKMDFDDLGSMVYIGEIDTDNPNEIILSYLYNTSLIKENFQAYKGEIDSHKVDIYTREEPKSKEFLEMLNNIDGYGDEGIIKWMSELQSDRQALENSALILKDSGVKRMCNDFQLLHNNTLQPERLIEVSQNELNYALMQYHREFSRILLNYLYKYQGYSYNNGQLMVNGSLVDAGTILSEKGKETLYDVEIINDVEGISAYYNTGSEEIQKLILKKE